MRIKDFCEGLRILHGDVQTLDVHAEHDILYCGGEEIKENSPEGRRLLDLGFHLGNEGWVIFT